LENLSVTAPRRDVLHRRRIRLDGKHALPAKRKDKAWARRLLKAAAAPHLKHWERLIGVHVEKVFVQRMKTKWGSCNQGARTIRLNTELAKKPPECLEYIIVHELVHLIEPTHNARFVALMEEFMPKWQQHRDMLNRLPVRHESWLY